MDSKLSGGRGKSAASLPTLRRPGRVVLRVLAFVVLRFKFSFYVTLTTKPVTRPATRTVYSCPNVLNCSQVSGRDRTECSHHVP